MRASVYIEHGVTVVDFTSVPKRNPCVGVHVEFNLDHTVITVSGYRQEWEYQDKPEVCSVIREDVKPNKARPEYLESYAEKIYRRAWPRWWIKVQVGAEIKGRVRAGWVRLKEEHEEGNFRIETSNWRIKYKD